MFLIKAETLWNKGFHMFPLAVMHGGRLSLQPNFQKGGTWGGLQFLHKKKLKSKIFNDKKILGDTPIHNIVSTKHFRLLLFIC